MVGKTAGLTSKLELMKQLCRVPPPRQKWVDSGMGQHPRVTQWHIWRRHHPVSLQHQLIIQPVMIGEICFQFIQQGATIMEIKLLFM